MEIWESATGTARKLRPFVLSENILLYTLPVTPLAFKVPLILHRGSSLNVYARPTCSCRALSTVTFLRCLKCFILILNIFDPSSIMFSLELVSFLLMCELVLGDILSPVTDQLWKWNKCPRGQCRAWSWDLQFQCFITSLVLSRGSVHCWGTPGCRQSD